MCVVGEIVVIVILLVVWFLDRKASFGYSTTGPEPMPMQSKVLGPEGMKVSQFKIESLLQATWDAWARFRGFPIFSVAEAAKSELKKRYEELDAAAAADAPAKPAADPAPR
jgi:hypothetical protein